MKIAIAQMRVYAHQPQKNYQTIKNIVKQYEDQCDLIVFPEMCLGGYFVQDKYFHNDFQQQLLDYNPMIKSLSTNVGIIWGNIHFDGQHCYNSAFFAYQQQWVHSSSQNLPAGLYYKQLLPNYGVFDDKRYFALGSESVVFNFKNSRVAVQICEDLWDELYGQSPTQEALAFNPDCFINISCSPWVQHKETVRLQQIKRQNLKVPFVYVNCVGMQNTGKNIVLFDGNSQVVTTQGVYNLNDCFQEEVAIVNLQQLTPRSNPTPHKLYTGLVSALRYLDEELLPYGPQWVVGVSGGLDSSVSLALLVAAFGAKRVEAVTLPSKHTSSTTFTNAHHLAEKLQVTLHTMPIETLARQTIESLNESGYQQLSALTIENIQARLRGHLLMSVSGATNGVVVNNGNKIEIALGYCTLYGDAIGVVSLLGDLTKLDVATVATTINQLANSEVIPNVLIPQTVGNELQWGFKPSAELKDNQSDPMKWGYHDVLIPYLMKHSVKTLLLSYQSGAFFNDKRWQYAKSYGLDQPHAFIDDLQWVLKTMQNAVYKRIQMPPIVSVSSLSYGTDYRESQLYYQLSDDVVQLMEAIKKHNKKS